MKFCKNVFWLTILTATFVLFKIDSSYAFEDSVKSVDSGLVIIQSLIPNYFERLGLTKNGNFISRESQNKAIVYLHYMATGETTYNDDQSLNLEKILCGVDLSESIDLYIEVNSDVQQLSKSLIASTISYWPSSGSNSISAFQNNWIQRTGLITNLENNLKLVVEKRKYDILLKNSPFNYNYIKFPWMQKSLTVIWPI